MNKIIYFSITGVVVFIITFFTLKNTEGNRDIKQHTQIEKIDYTEVFTGYEDLDQVLPVPCEEMIFSDLNEFLSYSKQLYSRYNIDLISMINQGGNNHVLDTNFKEQQMHIVLYPQDDVHYIASENSVLLLTASCAYTSCMQLFFSYWLEPKGLEGQYLHTSIFQENKNSLPLKNIKEPGEALPIEGIYHEMLCEEVEMDILFSGYTTVGRNDSEGLYFINDPNDIEAILGQVSYNRLFGEMNYALDSSRNVDFANETLIISVKSLTSDSYIKGIPLLKLYKIDEEFVPIYNYKEEVEEYYMNNTYEKYSINYITLGVTPKI